MVVGKVFGGIFIAIGFLVGIVSPLMSIPFSLLGIGIILLDLK